jgi:Cdc6-like AAA superfamily ATPase
MTTEEKLEILRWRNPFTSSSVGDPREGIYPDVPSINEHAFKGLCQLIKQKSQNPGLNCGALVLGEVGSGKTHLIGKILQYTKQVQSESDTPGLSFAYIQPIEDPEQTYRYLLREIIINLCYPVNEASPVTQLERVLDEIYREVVQKYGSTRDKDKQRNISGALLFKYIIPHRFKEVEDKAIDLLSRAYPEISTSFLKVLFQYRIPGKRVAALNWLKGCVLDQADAALLQVSDRSQVSEDQTGRSNLLEQEARDILISLGLLLARYRQTLVICFDRLENLETDGKIYALGKMLEFLIDKAKAMLPIVCFRGGEWEGKFRLKLNQHIITRLETNRFELRGCTADQAMAIIQNRLASVLGEDPTNPFFPFDREELYKTFKKQLYIPRLVIAEANKRLRQILDQGPSVEVSPSQTLEEEFENQYRVILQDFERYQPDRGRLRRALEAYLRYGSAKTGKPDKSIKSPAAGTSQTGLFQVESLQRPEGKEKYIDFTGTIRVSSSSEVPVIFMIDVEQNPVSVGACLLKGIEFLKSHPSGKAFYIRDARCPIPPPPQWKATNEKLQLFKDLGGHVIILDPEQAARWYALALLSYAVKEGDITLIGLDNRIKSITSEEFATFIGEKLQGQKHSGFQNIEEALGASPGEKSETPRSSLRDPNTKETTEEAEQGLRALIQALDTLKLPVEPLGYITGPRFIRYKIRPRLDQGVTVKKLVNQAENLQVALGLQVAPLIQPQAGYVSIDMPRKVRIPLTLGEVWQKGQRNRPPSKVAFPLGMSIDGSIVWANLSDPTMSGILVGGTSGSGKSIFLKASAVGLALNAKPTEVQLILIDPKRVGFMDLASLPHLSGPILMDTESVLEKLHQLVDEMEERYHMFEKKGVSDIHTYNQLNGPLSHQVIMIDEYADLMADKDTRTDLETSIQRLGQKGRAAGIHLILSTQRPDARVVTPIIKANLQLKVALKVTSAANSSIILDTPGAEYLIGHGDMLIGGSVPLQRLQGPLVTKTEIEMAMQNQ